MTLLSSMASVLPGNDERDKIKISMLPASK